MFRTSCPQTFYPPLRRFFCGCFHSNVSRFCRNSGGVFGPSFWRQRQLYKYSETMVCNWACPSSRVFLHRVLGSHSLVISKICLYTDFRHSSTTLESPFVSWTQNFWLGDAHFVHGDPSEQLLTSKLCCHQGQQCFDHAFSHQTMPRSHVNAGNANHVDSSEFLAFTLAGHSSDIG